MGPAYSLSYCHHGEKHGGLEQRTEIQNSDAMQGRSTEVVGSAVAIRKALTKYTYGRAGWFH